MLVLWKSIEQNAWPESLPRKRRNWKLKKLNDSAMLAMACKAHSLVASRNEQWTSVSGIRCARVDIEDMYNKGLKHRNMDEKRFDYYAQTSHCPFAI